LRDSRVDGLVADELARLESVHDVENTMGKARCAAA
jgi:hypothetical protein